MKRPQGFDAQVPGQRGSEKRDSARPVSAPLVSAQRVSGPRDSAPKIPVPSEKVVRSKKWLRSGTHAPPLKAERTSSDKVVRQEARASGASLRATARERRRFERREVRRFTRRARNRRLTWLVAVSVVATLIGLLAIAVYSPLLALRTITIDGASKVSAQAVKGAIDGQLGTPLALIDYGKLRTELDAFPLIRSFATEVIPPSTLKVHILERAPVGLISSPTGFTVVDPAGVVLETTPRRPNGVPLIDLGGAGTNSVAFTAVVDVILALPESLRTRVDIVQATSKDDVRLILVDAGQRVVWGSAERSALKARVLVELMAAQGANAHVEFDVSAPLSPVVRPG